ncbi:MAG: VOC family protein [Deltaproteobacteria bacterium]|nr:VOC family protein [Deltaproteobacteria bacterium]
MNQIASISVYVHDLGAAKRFYVETLGFVVEETMGDYGFKLSHPGVSLVVLSGGKRAEPGYPAGVVLGIPVSNAEQAAQRLRKAGATLVIGSPEPFPLGRFIAAADPSGNVVELLELTQP